MKVYIHTYIYTYIYMYKSIHTHVHVYIYKSANPARAKKLEVDRGMGHGRSIVNLKKRSF